MNSTKLLGTVSAVLFAFVLAGCSASSQGGTTTGNPLVADSSSSGAVAGAVGGALSGSSASGVVATSEYMTHKNFSAKVSAESTTCPTFVTAQGSGCDASGSSLWLTYGTCKYPNSTATFTGVQALIMSSGTATCGTFPAPSSGGTLTRQYVASSGGTTTSYLLVRDAAGIGTYIDNHTANLGNFNGDTLNTILNGGYGAIVDFSGTGGSRSSITLGHRIYILGGVDQTVYGTLSITETAGSSSRTVSGNVTVYHNALQVIGTSTLTNVVHNDMCCLPVSGSIKTVFTAGTVSPTALGSLYVGKSETLTFTGCGTGTIVNYDGSTQSLTLNRCF